VSEVAANEVTDPLNAVFPAAVDPAAAAPTARRRFRRRRTNQSGAAGADPIADALAELVLLREENARLKAARHQEPSFGGVVGQMRAMRDLERAEDAADDAAEMLAEVVVLRDSLLEVCEELERAMASVRARLDRVGSDESTGRVDPIRPAGAEDVRAS
jgi:hypothetical protein